jgi:hypothetical protein
MSEFDLCHFFQPFIPLIQKRITRKLNEQLFLGYDVARGFVHASDEVGKFLPQMIENRRVLKKVKQALDIERNECMRSMGKRYVLCCLSKKMQQSVNIVDNAFEFCFSYSSAGPPRDRDCSEDSARLSFCIEFHERLPYRIER